ncbi:MAG: DUF4037 domain-containing protein [Clostridia bacterium]|nr:DUF4037 domain-containing protein [Clostridia bacterium]
MTGLELSKAYYEQVGKPVLERDFPELMPYLAIGLAGAGSECLGYDDEVSQDHDFGPGFCIWLPDEAMVDRRSAFLLERAYAKLDAEFMGYKRPKIDPVGGARKGVMRYADFFTEKTGTPDGVLSDAEWLTIPYASLTEATNGEVFADPFGGFSAVRERLARMPEDIRKKRLAGHLLLMAQSGQYNYQRCLDHGEPEAARLAATEFVKNAVSAAFLLNGRTEPYYKWAFRALRALPELSGLAPALSKILTLGDEPEPSFEKYNLIEDVASAVIGKLMDDGLTEATCGDLEKHAYSVNDGIADGAVRNLHVLAGV